MFAGALEIFTTIHLTHISPALNFVFAFRIMIQFYNVNFPILYVKVIGIMFDEFLSINATQYIVYCYEEM
jgi:hypothetical protein